MIKTSILFLRLLAWYKVNKDDNLVVWFSFTGLMLFSIIPKYFEDDFNNYVFFSLRGGRNFVSFKDKFTLQQIFLH